MNVLEVLSQVGIFILLAALIVGLIYLVSTMSRELQDQKRDVSALRKEFMEVVGPAFDGITKIMENQDHINKELLRQMDTQSQVLSELKELRTAYHGLTTGQSRNALPDNTPPNADD